MKYSILLFDADNTLFDYNMAENLALKHTFEEFDIFFTDDVRRIYKKYNDKLWKDLEKGLVTKDDLKVLRFTQTLAELMLNKNAKQMSKVYTFELGKGTQLLPGAKKLVENVALDHKLYIVTNGILEVQNSRIGNSEISDHILEIYTSEGIGFTKPDKNFFTHVLSDLKIDDKSKILVVGDSLSADIKGANNAGLDCCWYNPENIVNKTDSVPTFEVSNFSQMLDIINQKHN